MTTEPSIPALSVGLSTEEMIYLLDSLRVPDLPGVDREGFSKLDPEAQQVALQVAQRGLLARQLLIPADGKLQHNPLLLSMLAPNFAPEHSLLLWQQTGGNEGRMFFGHSWQAVHVLRWLSALGIHQFLLLPSKEALAKAVLDLLPAEPATAAPGPAHHLAAEAFEQAQSAAAEQGAPAAAARLVAAGLPAEAASALAADLAAPQGVYSLVGTHRNEDQADSAFALTLVQGRDTTWIADYGPAAASGQVTLRAGTPAEVHERVRAFVASY